MAHNHFRAKTSPDFAGLKCPGRDSNPHALRRHPLKMVCLPVPPPGLTAVSTHTTRLRFAGKHLDGRLQGFFGAGAVFFVGAGEAPGVAFFSAGTGVLSDGPALLAGEVSLPSFGPAG